MTTKLENAASLATVFAKDQFMDWIMALLILLLASTILAFAYGLIPYPYGVLILLAMLATRFFYMRNQK